MSAANNVVYYTPSADPERSPVPGADGRVHALMRRQLPRLHELAVSLKERVLNGNCATLEATLRSHLAAATSLRFELLVSPGLRAGPRDSDEAAFRRQVSAVSDCTEATWIAIKRFMERTAADASVSDSIASDFTMEFRSLHRRVTDEAASAASLQAHLAARAETAGGNGQKAIADLMARNASVRDALAQLQQLCEAARPAQGATYQLAQAHATLRATLTKLATRLSGGLLERLKVLVAGDVGAPADEMRSAQQARGELQAILADALADVARVQSASEDLMVWLDALSHRAAAMRPD